MQREIVTFPSAGLSESPQIPQRLIAARWIEDLQSREAAGEIAPNTVDTYRRQVAEWLDWLDITAENKPGPTAIRFWISSLREKDLKPATINSKLAAVKALYRWAETMQIWPDVARAVKSLPDKRNGPLECLEPSEIAALLDYVNGDEIAGIRDRAIVHVLFATAWRLSSLHTANVRDFERHSGEIQYRAKGDRSKGRKAILGASALQALIEYLDAREKEEGQQIEGDAPLFVAVGNRSKGNRLSIRSIRRVIIGLMEKAGHVSRDKDGNISRPGMLSAHSIRRSAVTAAADAAGIEAARILAGHADAKTTLRAYARVNEVRELKKLRGVLDLGQVAESAPNNSNNRFPSTDEK